MPDRLEQVSLLIDGGRWAAWSDLEIRRAVDEVSTVRFEAPFEPERPEFRETFQPFSYKPLAVSLGEETLFEGKLVGVDPDTEASSRRIAISGYALPGVLQDCTAPASAWPLELNGLRLSAIAQTLLEPFGIAVDAVGDEGAAFRRVALKPDERVWGFLVQLAQQRGMILSSGLEGELRIYRPPAAGQPVARLREGAPPLMSVRPTFQPQAYFSEVTGRVQTRAGAGGSAYTATNRRLSNVVRPHAFTLEDGDGADAPAATDAKLGRMFGEMVAYAVQLPTWRDPAGELWNPGTTVSLQAPGAMVYEPTDFIVRAVVYSQDAESQQAELELVLPGVYSGEVPDRLPWES